MLFKKICNDQIKKKVEIIKFTTKIKLYNGGKFFFNCLAKKMFSPKINHMVIVI